MLPTATEIFNKMGLGINIGNTMEVPGNPTGWGNKFPTEAYTPVHTFYAGAATR